MSEDTEIIRDESGRFVPGSGGGPGRKPGSRLAELRREMQECQTPEQVRNVMNKLYSLAVGGDLAAIGMYFDRLFGRPVAPLAVKTGRDGEPIDVVTTLDEKRSRLAALAARLNEGPVQIIETDDWYGTGAAQAVRQELLHDAEYLEFCRLRIEKNGSNNGHANGHPPST